MIVLIIFIIIVSTAVVIWLKHKVNKRSQNRIDRLQQKQEDVLEILKGKK